MSVEDDLHNLGPALDRAIDEAATSVTMPTVSVPTRNPWARRRAVVVTLAAAAAIAAIVGVIVRVDTDRHGVATTDTSTVSSATSSTTSTTATTTTTATPQPGVALQSVRWDSVAYPIEQRCDPVLTPRVNVGRVVYATPAAGVRIAVVMVSCNRAASQPTVAVYVYDRAASTALPHLSQTLIGDSDGWTADAASANGATISVPVHGYSTVSVARCCPDVPATLVWQWTGSRYRLVSAIPPHVKRHV